MAMKRGEFDREIRGDENAGEGEKGKGQKTELPNGRAVAKFHHTRIIPRRAHQGDNGLKQGHAKGEDKGDMSEFSAHEACT